MPASPVLKDAGGWEDKQLGRERGTYAGNPIRKQGSQGWSPCLQFPWIELMKWVPTFWEIPGIAASFLQGPESFQVHLSWSGLPPPGGTKLRPGPGQITMAKTPGTPRRLAGQPHSGHFINLAIWCQVLSKWICWNMLLLSWREFYSTYYCTQFYYPVIFEFVYLNPQANHKLTEKKNQVFYHS